MNKEPDVAMNREVASGEVVVLRLLHDECDLPVFQLYADYSVPSSCAV